jgi:hypothetical protein
MGTVTAKSIIDKAATQLTDISGVRWTRSELLGWLNDGLRQIVLIQPNASNVVTAIKMVAGTRQTLPSDGWLLMSVNRNMGTNGTTPGRAVRMISRELLDGFNPDWHTDTKTVAAKNYLYDIQDQTAFWVYPPNTGTGYVEINYSKQPTDLTAETQVIPIFDVYQQALLDYVLYRACSKDAEYAPGLQLGQGYLSTFVAAVQGKEISENKNNPIHGLLPRNPEMPGTET